MDHNDILVVGAPGVGKHYIIQHVTGNTSPVTWTPAHAETSPTDSTHHWNIHNKYYSATLCWHIHSPSAILTQSTCQHIYPQQRHSSVQALVIVYDPNQPHTWTAVESWHHYISCYNPSILLVIANHTRPPPPHAAPPCLPGPLSWCSEYGCEHIVIPHGNTLIPSPTSLTAPDTKPLTSDQSDRDMGCARVVDAMHANMWQVMERKQVTMGGPVDDIDECGESDVDQQDIKHVDDSVEDMTSCELHVPVDVPVPVPVPVPAHMDVSAHDDDIPDLIPKEEHKQKSDADGIKKTKNARKNQRKRDKKKEKAQAPTTITQISSTTTSQTTLTSSSTSLPTTELPDPTEFDNMSESDMERSLESFSAMFDRVRGIREQAASGQMSDEARRAQAAAAIMSMLQGLGIQDEADDGSDTEEQN